MVKISGVYLIVNTVTKDSYVGSSKDVKKRWSGHRCPSMWAEHPNSPLYLDMQKYGIKNFRFQILAPIEPENLKDAEQKFIEMLKPTYNSINAKGWNVEKIRKSQIKYRQSENRKEYMKKYLQSEKVKDYMKEYRQSEKYKKTAKESNKKYFNRLCYYKGEKLTLCALCSRFQRAGIDHPTQEARKYLIIEETK